MNNSFAQFKPYLKFFLTRFVIVFAIIGSFYYILYYYAPQKDNEIRRQEKLALQNIASKSNQINQIFSDLSQYNTIDDEDFIHSIALYREKITNALALGKEIENTNSRILKLRPSFILKMLLALAYKMPARRPDNAPILLKTQEALNDADALLNYLQENQKALQNLFEYIPELDFRGLSVGVGRAHFIDRLDRANTGLTKIVERLNALPPEIKNNDTTLKDIIATVESLRQMVISLKNAVIAGDSKLSESLKADFILQVRFAQRKTIKNRVDFLKNYIEQSKIPEKWETPKLKSEMRYQICEHYKYSNYANIQTI